MSHYFDSAATTSPSLYAVDTYNDVNGGEWYNPSSTIYNGGVRARVSLEGSRKTIAKTIGCKPDQIFFTSGSTEAANWIIQGQIPRGEEGDWLIICSPTEHPCVYNTVKYMESCGVLTHWLKVNDEGIVSINDLAATLLDPAMYRKHVLICVMRVNNETGVIQPIDEIVKMFEMDSEVLVMCDMTQSIAYDETINLGVDFAFASAHKFGGFKGCGFLYAKDPTALRPFMHGGHQESGMRPGTENVAAIAAMACALSDTRYEIDRNVWRMKEMRRVLLEALDDRKIEYTMKYSLHNTAPNIISLVFNGVDANKLIAMLNEDGFAVSAGSACSTGENKPSRVLKAAGYSDEEARSTLRISFSPENDIYEVKLLAEAIAKRVKGGMCKLE